jgi:hypothetical protein
MFIDDYDLATDSMVLFIPEVGCVELEPLERSPESILLAQNRGLTHNEVRKRAVGIRDFVSDPFLSMSRSRFGVAI